MPNALVVRTAGTNCDVELERAFTLAGAEVTKHHLHLLARKPDLLDRFDIVAFAGGFSYGDDVASGRIFAMRVRERLYPALLRAIDRGVPMMGVCNGFQVLTQVGLLPGPPAGRPWPADPPPQSVTLTDNASARFIDAWTPIEINAGSPCIWTKGMEGADPDVLMLPSAHGEGRLVTASPDVLQDLEQSGRVVFRYLTDINGSEGAIGGICDSSGLILGLMPHPERYLDWTRHPYWTRLDPAVRTGPTPGLRFFQNAVRHAPGAPATRASGSHAVA
jgi:phosphoribosylformylglycinamidine synthase